MGGGIARVCENNNGTKIKLIDHMKTHWETIGFKPSSFHLDMDDSLNNEKTADAPIKTNTHFTPPQKPIPIESQETNLIGVVVKNLPENIPEEDIIKFLSTKGLDQKDAEIKIHHNKKNTNVDIEGISNETIAILIKNLHENIFFNKKVYCRGLQAVHTPKTKKPSDITSAAVETNQGNQNTSPLLKQIPGLPIAEQKKAEKKKQQETSKNEKKTIGKKKKGENKTGSSVATYISKEDPKLKDFLFKDDEDNSESRSEDDSKKSPGFPWRRSPLYSETDREKNLNKFLSIPSFSSVSAKKIQKEQTWLQQSTSGPLKRPLASPTDENLRRLRSKSISCFE